MGTAWSKTDIKWSDKYLTDLIKANAEFCPPNRREVRIGLFGMLSTGKSSYLDAIETCMTGKLCTSHVVQSGRSADQPLTKEFREFTLRYGEKRTRISVVDFQGVAGDEQVKRITDMIDSKSDKIDLPVFVFDGGDSVYSNRGHTSFSLIKEILAFCVRNDIPSMCLLTRVDQLLGGKGAEYIYRKEEVHTRVKELSEALGVPENRILPQINYTSERQRRRDIDIITMYNLSKLLATAESRIRHYSEESSAMGSDFQEVQLLRHDHG